MTQRTLTPAHITVLGGLAATALLLIVRRPLAWIPPLIVIGLVLMAPFIPGWGFFLPVISRGRRDSKDVALTFDDGPDPATTAPLLALLARRGTPAAFFVTGRRARAHPDLVRAIVQAGHAVGNHSFRHNSLMGFRGQHHVYKDIALAQRILAGHGIHARWFRPPVGITYPGLGTALARLGLTAVTFSRRAGDRGNKTIAHIAEKILAKAAGGDIIMLHDLSPGDDAAVARWLDQVDAVLTGLAAKGLQVVPLADLVDGRPAAEAGGKKIR